MKGKRKRTAKKHDADLQRARFSWQSPAGQRIAELQSELESSQRLNEELMAQKASFRRRVMDRGYFFLSEDNDVPYFRDEAGKLQMCILRDNGQNVPKDPPHLSSTGALRGVQQVDARPNMSIAPFHTFGGGRNKALAQSVAGPHVSARSDEVSLPRHAWTKDLNHQAGYGYAVSEQSVELMTGQKRSRSNGWQMAEQTKPTARSARRRKLRRRYAESNARAAQIDQELKSVPLSRNVRTSEAPLAPSKKFVPEQDTSADRLPDQSALDHFYTSIIKIGVSAGVKLPDDHQDAEITQI